MTPAPESLRVRCGCHLWVKNLTCTRQVPAPAGEIVIPNSNPVCPIQSPTAMARTNWEADKMLDVYIYDYLVKRNLQATAKAFISEEKVATDPVAIDAPNRFLLEWWSIF
ncbi:hypothetical protein PR202_gb29604 [Eleusine coracana subsp. coracana]|uniref:LisH domain-containing protein n=1 Tax=Eleusine coracana subsp. coracana TaxID=191504 RepID=A0AAV5FZH3_ELECO|nr:hypothetical protein PR202_gb29604 [Eleusine coracana subsp. coracana]